MTTVALIGADGSGKTTICRHLQNEQPSRFKYIYMGVNADASNLALPTTRLSRKLQLARGKETAMGGPPNPTITKNRPNGFLRQTAGGLKSSLRVANLLAEEMFRQAAAWSFQLRGYIVLFDRHYYFDYYAYDIVENGSSRPISRRIHGFFLGHVYPRPDLVIVLDAPSAILFARKGEGSPELVESRRQEYLQLKDKTEHLVIIDASQSLEKVIREVSVAIQELCPSEPLNHSEASDGHVG